MEIHGVVVVEDQYPHLKTGTNLNVSTVVSIDILRNKVRNFMGAHMIYLLVDSIEEDPVVVVAVAGLEVTV